jgi:hypothetical protein
MDRINNAFIIKNNLLLSPFDKLRVTGALNFFEPVNRFKKEPEANKPGDDEDDC